MGQQAGRGSEGHGACPKPQEHEDPGTRDTWGGVGVRTVALEVVGSGGGYVGANNLTRPCMGGLEELDFILRAQVGGGHQRF